MAFVSILKIPDSDELRVVSSEEHIAPERFVTEEGTFAERIDPVVFEREVPNPQVLLQELREVLASSKVNGAEDTFLCPAPIAIRAVEVAASHLWPTKRAQCPDCQHFFMIPYPARKRMYLACPHCHNALMNPSWDSA